MEFTKVKYAVDGKKATILMDSPKNMNAFDETMLDELEAAVKMADKEEGVKVVVLGSSSPKAFSAGGDIGAMYEGLKDPNGVEEFGKAIAKMANVTKAVKKCSKPVIAAIQGACAGAGFNLALACDYVIATDTSMFIQAFVKIGLIPDAGGMYLLTRAIGVSKALEIAMTGDIVFAEDAKTLGFVAEVVDADDFEEAVAKRAKKFGYGPSTSYAEMKRLVWESEFKDFEKYVEEEVKSQMICGDTEDFKEGVSAFVEKRKPAYK